MKIRVPLKLVCSPNTGEHWATKYKRDKAQAAGVYLMLKAYIPPPIELPCHVILTRIAPRMLDRDNLVASFKAIQDIVASHIKQDFRPGRADNDPRIEWVYHQEKGQPKEYAIEIQILPPAADIPFQ